MSRRSQRAAAVANLVCGVLLIVFALGLLGGWIGWFE